MVLESTMILLDNSDYQRNGDYLPTRLSVQKEAVHLVCTAKLRQNPENNVGLITTANTVEVLTTLTTEAARIYSKMQKIALSGEINLLTAIRIAHLVLKHRQGKNHKMRIVAFVGSPVRDTEVALVQCAKRLKKEKVNIDIVCYGEHNGNEGPLVAFIAALNGKDGNGSHFMNVPRGCVISDTLISSPIIQGEDGQSAPVNTAGFEFGIDPNEDPDLLLALRISMEEERARHTAQVGQNSDNNERCTTDTGGNTQSENVAAAGLQQPLGQGVDVTRDPRTAPLEIAIPDFTQMSEEEQIAFALQMSMQGVDDDVNPEPMDTDNNDDDTPRNDESKE